MPERSETLMRTRCPACGTIFRVTSGQLRSKAGKVRCGQCQQVFNAFDHLLGELPAETPPANSEPALSAVATHADVPAATYTAEPEVEFSPEVATSVGDETIVAHQVEDFSTFEAPVSPEKPEFSQELPAPAVHEEKAVNFDETVVMPRDADDETLVATAVLPEPVADETPEASTQAARDAGLVAVRELSDTTAFNRWAAGALASDGVGGFEEDASRRPTWLYVVFALLLGLGLAAQFLYYFRTPLVQRVPLLAGLYAVAEIDVPLPRDTDLVVIESSDLQFDNARSLFVLQATLRNRARYAQAWPTLELTLTDTNDNVVARRVMYAAHYLPPGTPQDAFKANGEVAVRLWIDAKELGAVGYRLYLFYP